MYEPSFTVYNEITGRYLMIDQLGFRPDPPKEVVAKAQKECKERLGRLAKNMMLNAQKGEDPFFNDTNNGRP